MTFKKHVNKIHIILAIAILAALMIPVLGFTAGQTIASHEVFDSGLVENAQLHDSPASQIACACGDPGGGNPCC